MSYRVRLAKESFKFSATHFTILSPTTAERLHGHNYQVAVECSFRTVDELGMGFEFNQLKPLVKAAADRWDEHVLIANSSPHLQVKEESIRGVPHLQVDFQNRSYRFPASDVVLLDCKNVTSEELARLFSMRLLTDWKNKIEADLASRIEWFETHVEETRGQSACHRVEYPFGAASSGKGSTT